MPHRNHQTETPGRIARAGITAAAVAAVTLLGAAPAAAHVHVDADSPESGSSAILTFQVPNESDSGARTTEISIALPGLTSVRTQQLPGWTARLDRDVAAGTVRSVTWTAAPQGGIPPDEFGLFRVSVMLPETDTVSFPATQTYSDGTVVQWNQPTPPDGAEPDYPAPSLTLAPQQEGAHHPHAGSTQAAAPSAAPGTADPTARWLAGAAVILASAAAGLALLRRRRS